MLFTLEKYSDKSFKLSGEDTKLIKNGIKSCNGRWNPNLQGGKGWIFSNKQYGSLNDVFATLQFNMGIQGISLPELDKLETFNLEMLLEPEKVEEYIKSKYPDK